MADDLNQWNKFLVSTLPIDQRHQHSQNISFNSTGIVMTSEFTNISLAWTHFVYWGAYGLSISKTLKFSNKILVTITRYWDLTVCDSIFFTVK